MKTILSAFILLSLCFTSCTFSSSTTTSTGSKTSKTTRTINGAEIRYNETITEEQANTLIDYLKKNDFFDGTPIKVQVGKLDNVIHFAMVINNKDAASEDYQALGTVMIDELEQKVFTGNKVEIDYCDENFNVQKNIKGERTTPDVTTVSTTDGGTVDASLLPYKHWYCDTITGGAPKDAVLAAKELEIIRNRFSFDFEESGTFGSWFINQADLENPMEVQGDYTVEGNTITFSKLIISGQPTNQQMQFGFSATDDMFQLISKAVGQPDLVMTFKHD